MTYNVFGGTLNLTKPFNIDVYYFYTFASIRVLEACCLFGCVAQLAERRSLAGELTLSCARPAADE